MRKSVLSTREKYDRRARYYDLMELFPESLFFGKWRRELFSKIGGRNLLELGVGTGKNPPYYPKGISGTAIDFSERMMLRTRRRAEKLGVRFDARLLGR